jgi:hypothetical protein
MSYKGPIEVGMVMVAPGNDGEVYRRDRVIGRHPFEQNIVLLEALPCPMRRERFEIGEVIRCPEINLRLISTPEDQFVPTPATESEKESATLPGGNDGE